MERKNDLPTERATLLEFDKPADGDRLNLLRGSVIRYDDPMEPVAVKDWEIVSAS